MEVKFRYLGSKEERSDLRSDSVYPQNEYQKGRPRASLLMAYDLGESQTVSNNNTNTLSNKFLSLDLNIRYRMGRETYLRGAFRQGDKILNGLFALGYYLWKGDSDQFLPPLGDRHDREREAVLHKIIDSTPFLTERGKEKWKIRATQLVQYRKKPDNYLSRRKKEKVHWTAIYDADHPAREAQQSSNRSRRSEALDKLAKAWEELKRLLGRDPGVNELHRHTGVRKPTIKTFLTGEDNDREEKARKEIEEMSRRFEKNQGSPLAEKASTSPESPKRTTDRPGNGAEKPLYGLRSLSGDPMIMDPDLEKEDHIGESNAVPAVKRPTMEDLKRIIDRMNQPRSQEPSKMDILRSFIRPVENFSSV